jgi:hypothetical protein
LIVNRTSARRPTRWPEGPPPASHRDRLAGTDYGACEIRALGARVRSRRGSWRRTSALRSPRHHRSCGFCFEAELAPPPAGETSSVPVKRPGSGRSSRTGNEAVAAEVESRDARATDGDGPLPALGRWTRRGSSRTAAPHRPWGGAPAAIGGTARLDQP